MARSDLLLNLVRAGIAGDTSLLRRTVEAIVAEERAKQHNVVADQLERVLWSSNGGTASPGNRPVQEATRARDYVAEVVPRRRLDDLVLPTIVRLAVMQLLEEQQRATLLRSYSLEPRHRVLLVGPPGNGKTTLAEAIAESLALPFFVVRYETIIGSFLGETAGRLKRVFDYVRTTPCVLFFDEFDAVGKERGDIHETGEIKRVVTSLLMQIDELPSYVVAVAATNHSELLDRAVWRRFELRLSLPAPSRKRLIDFIERLRKRMGIDFGLPTAHLVKEIGAVSYSEAEQFCLDLARRQVLAGGDRLPADLAREQLRIWVTRVRDRGRDA